MGISLEEYLADRKACAHCESTGNQLFCTTNLLSNEETCIFYNALTRNGDPHDDTDVLLLQNFRSMNTEETVIDYYVRSKNIVKDLNEKGGDSQKLWMDITLRYVRPILDEVRANNNPAALSKIHTMLGELEQGA